MSQVILWLIIFSIIAIWFAAGYKICKSNSNMKKMKQVNARECKRFEEERTRQFESFIHSNAWEKIASLEPIPYSPEPHESDTGGDESY